MEGTVKWFDEKRGYGFLAGEDGRDYFCHWKNIQDQFDQDGRRCFATLAEGAKVTFMIEEKDGRKQATNVLEIPEKGTEKGSEIGAKMETKKNEKVM